MKKEFNKKAALMVKVIVTFLLAAIVLVSSVTFGARIYKVATGKSDQAFNNFKNLNFEIKQLENSESKNFNLVMDPETFVVLFKEEKKVFLYDDVLVIPGDTMNGKPIAGRTTVTKSYVSPSEECSGFPCLCLCREVQDVDKINENKVCEDKLECRVLEGVKVKESFSVYRENEKEPRRYNIALEKINDEVSLRVSK